MFENPYFSCTKPLEIPSALNTVPHTKKAEPKIIKKVGRNLLKSKMEPTEDLLVSCT